MTTALAKKTVKSLVAQPEFQSRFKEVLGTRAPQFISSMINVANQLGDVEPYSVIQSAMIAATLDLPIDKNLGFAWIVPFKKGGEKFAQFQMGYKGFVQLGLRSGQYKRMNARAINAEALGGFDEVGEPIIKWDLLDDTKPTAGYVFAFQLVNGFTKCSYWAKARVEEHARKYSQSFRGGYDSPWKSHFDEMALKTVIKNELSKWGILSIQMQKAIETDQGVIDVEGNVQFYDNADQPQLKAPDFTEGPQVTAPTPAAKTRRPPAREAHPSPQPELSAQSPDDGDLGPQTPAEPPPARNDATKLREIMGKLDITEEQLLAFCERKNIKSVLDDVPTTLEQLPGNKIAVLVKNLGLTNSPMAGEIKSAG